jgi:predicted MFS family arabinose efflux permease
MQQKWVIVISLGVTQTLAWASSFYLPAMLAESISRDIDLSPSWVYAALSFGLGVSAVLGPFCGRLIDERGGRLVLCMSNLLFAAGLVLLASAQGAMSLLSAWFVLGVAMAAGLYEAAFAATTRLYGSDSGGSITGITLIAGFASTVGWPITALLDHSMSWRGACLGWAAVHLSLGLPLNAWALSGRLPLRHPLSNAFPATCADPPLLADRRMLILAFMFTASGIVSIGVATTLPRLFEKLGATPAAAITAAALLGPAQVAARILEFGSRRWSNALLIAKVANTLHPIGALALTLVGAPAVPFFALIHGAGNGILTIARGTLPLAMYGPVRYGARLGQIAAPARVGQAVAPLLFGIAIDRLGSRLLLITAALSVLALLSLFKLPEARARLVDRIND